MFHQIFERVSASSTVPIVCTALLFGFIGYKSLKMFSGDAMAGTYNADVLDAQPTTEEATASLVEEIKNRAKGCISTRNYPEAIKLYTKAIEVSETNLPAKAILHANRSMCHLGMNNSIAASADASQAVKTDPTYIKGYYRQAMAQCGLKNFRGAREALKQGLTLKPDDKELKAQLVKVEAELSRNNFESSADKSPRVTSASSSSSSTPISSTNTSAKTSSKPAASKPAAASSANDDDDDDEDVKNLNLRGYKTTSDGRKTTFFNNELDETAKALIGSIAPKKLEVAAAPVVVADNSVGSAWNSAGTYEEKIVTPYVNESLTTLLSAVQTTVTGADLVKLDAYTAQSVSGIELKVTGVEGLTGHAQITMMRGKKKHMCDMCVDVKYALTIHTATGDQVVEGKLNIVDITADQEYEFSGSEVTTYNKNTATASSLPQFAGNLYTTYVKKGDNKKSLQKLVHIALMQFCAEFKTK